MKSLQLPEVLPESCRPPRGGRGLKLLYTNAHSGVLWSPPRGGRGLKYYKAMYPDFFVWSPPARGAWIEIAMPERREIRFSVAPREGGVD